MLSNKRVLPNFLSTLLFAVAAIFSVNAFAGDHGGKTEAAIGELKDMEKTTANHDGAATQKTTLDETKENMLDKLSGEEATAAEKVEGLQPE